MASNPNGAGNQVARYLDLPLTRHDFPTDFLWGAATSTYQVEGAYNEDGKSHCNWDAWTTQNPGKVTDGNNGCVAIDHYNRFKDDVKLMKKLGLDTYRFSISWPRILPGGRLSTGVNRDGVKFYNDLIDTLLAEGIIPFVTIFHFDVPQCLLDEYGAFMDRKVVQDFAEFAEVCFFEFGDRVKHWITMNEPWTYTAGGYIMGNFPPGHGSTTTHPEETKNQRHRCPLGVDKTCFGGDASTEPYIVAHHLLISHATAVDIYRKKYQAVQGGKIGITNMSTWYEAYNPKSQLDIDAASRAVDFQWGWFTSPVVKGDYPDVMRERVKERLPIFTDEEKDLLTGSFDFIGMNYYTTYFAENDPTVTPPENATYYTDQGLQSHTSYPDGTPIGEQAGSAWLYIVPRGIHGLLTHNATHYGNPIVYITENGVDEKNTRIPVSQAIQDDYRIKYFNDHFAFMKKAIADGVNLKGYMLWSLFDNFEWAEGYSVRFGIYYVDYTNGLIRYPKNSAIWYMNFLNKNLPAPAIKRQVVEEIEADNTSVKKKRTRNN